MDIFVNKLGGKCHNSHQTVTHRMSQFEDSEPRKNLPLRVRGMAVEPALRDRVPAQVAHHYQCLPMGQRDGVLQVAVADPLDVRALDDLQGLLDGPVEPVPADADEIQEALQRWYGIGADTVEDLRAGAGPEVGRSKTEDLDEGEGEASVARLVNQILTQAHRARATDVHLEPEEGKDRKQKAVGRRQAAQPSRTGKQKAEGHG